MKIPYLSVQIQDSAHRQAEIRFKQDEFLDVYSLYLQAPVTWIRSEVCLKAYELRLLDPSFTFQI